MRYIKASIVSRIIYSVISALLVISLGACSNGVPASVVSEIPQYTLPPVKEEALPMQGGSLTFPIPKNPATLNPLQIENVELYNLYTLIYEQPIRFGLDGKAQPELAETWDVDDTGTIWTFKLRQGVQWQGGYGEMTSADVIYTIDLIKGYTADQSPYAQYNSHIVNYNAPDDYTVTITLDSPGYLGVYFMTFPVVCKTYCTAGSIDSLNPIGTGPYEVVSYDPDVQMDLGINSLWWKRAPYIQTLTAVCYDDHAVELAVFDQNLLDFVTTSVLTVETYANHRHTSVDYLTQYYDCLVPNTAGAFFSDVTMRQVIGYALDRRDIISKALLGHAVATDYPISPDSYLSGTSSNIYEFNQQKARELLELAGWKDRNNDGICERVEGTQIINLQIELLIPLNKENTYRHDVAENIKSQLAASGIIVNIVEVSADPDSNEYLQRLQSGNFDLALCSFYMDKYPDISFMVGTGGNQNYGQFSDTALDQMLTSCKSALTEQAMMEAYSAMEQRFIETVPQIGLYFKTNALIYDNAIAVSGDLRDLNLYTTIPQWYRYVKNAQGEAVLNAEATIEPTVSPTPSASPGE